MSEILNDLKKYADHRGFPEELPNFNTTASRAVREVVRLRAQLAKATAVLEEILFGEDIDEMRRAAGIALRQVQK